MKLHPMSMVCVGPPLMTLDGPSFKIDLWNTLRVAWQFSHRVDW
jgi:hypothetical protein